MNIAIIGASGFIGSAILTEALSRQHKVTAFVAHPEKLAATNQLQVIATDVQDLQTLSKQLTGFDAIISAFSGHANGDTLRYYVSGISNIIQAARDIQTPRLLVVGGAGSLEVAPGVQVLDTPDFPEAYRASAEGARTALQLLRQETTLNWTMLSPSAMIAPGQRTGHFRLGKDNLLIAADGKSHISVEDYAVAMINELEVPANQYQRFTVGY
ncbi:NAD(P)-dependent oxidoreductase [Undibacterium sp.]|uniref:NAD(P)-dependent oxidoreductase n=1 Tax=Undibacterium sp. TaxID=1914977 RepID=UPI00272F93A4|nr:NAD(P)-dependent oxidoreductase [Undibacterium sp.]MDP1979769.1 NAD(P)-dependent oxidoreductase [Undibacterium sp.]